jgi:hypothetical protein
MGKHQAPDREMVFPGWVKLMQEVAYLCQMVQHRIPDGIGIKPCQSTAIFKTEWLGIVLIRYPFVYFDNGFQ